MWRILSLSRNIVVHIGRGTPNMLRDNSEVVFALRTTFITNENPEDDPLHVPARLKAIACHRGATLRSGHYYSYRLEGKQWYIFDDDHPCEPVSEEKVLSEHQTVYMLAYERLRSGGDGGDGGDGSGGSGGGGGGGGGGGVV